MAKGTFRFNKIQETIFLENELDAVGACSALEVERSLLTIKPQDFSLRGLVAGVFQSSIPLPENVKRKLGC